MRPWNDNKTLSEATCRAEVHELQREVKEKEEHGMNQGEMPNELSSIQPVRNSQGGSWTDKAEHLNEGIRSLKMPRTDCRMLGA